MNNFKALAKLTHLRKQKINALYNNIDQSSNFPLIIKQALLISELEDNACTRLALLKRFIDLKEENLLQEWKKAGFDEKKISILKYKIYDKVKAFYEKEHKKLIQDIQKQKLLDEFFIVLLKGVHKIGLIMNKWQKSWSKLILDKNNKILEQEFSSLKEALRFLKSQHLYQKDEKNEPCERSYGALIKTRNGWNFLPYALVFKKEILKIETLFNALIQDLQVLAKNTEEQAYIIYLEKLKLAFCEKDNDKIIKAWQEAELAWLKIKSPLQIAHPLEYYEDNYTHAVALEWDLRLNDENEFDSLNFTKNIKESFSQLYAQMNIKDEKLFKEVQNNLEHTQLYICMPMLYYGAELNGLFSAQVVPNDEFVSNIGGKKIFAFLNFVYENAKNQPFMKLAPLIFEAEFLKYGRDILFFQEKIWKKVYEISTIGHEFGHIFFIAKESEKIMNKSGVFKNIEEFKATAGGLVNFFLHEEEALKMPVFHELIKRAINLIAWQELEEVKPYYTEGLIHLSLLFKSKILSFEKEKLKIDFSLEAYEKFKNEFLNTYKELALHYIKKLDAKDFLYKFCFLKDGVFLPLNEQCQAFVKYYHKKYQELGNVLDESGEFQKYKFLSQR